MAKKVYSNLIQSTYTSRHPEGRTEDSNFSRVIPSNDEFVTETLLKHIQNNEPIEFRDLLLQLYIYKPHRNSREVDDHGSSYDTRSYEYYYGEPIFERLFLHRKDLLLKIVDQLIEKNDEMLFRIFHLDIFQSKQITEVNLKVLFKINQVDFNKGIDKLKKHSSKQEIIQPLLKTLQSLTDTFDYNPTNQVLPTVQLYKNLKTKLQIANVLETGKAKLNVHRNSEPLRILLDLSISLFSLTIANVINKCRTGKWSFYNQNTTSSCYTEEIERNGLRFR